MTSERRIAAIVFTDIVGFSALSQKNEALSLELLNEHFKLLRPLISEHSGNEIKTIGDSLMIEFASPLSAVECAIAFQRALHIRNIDEPEERKILIRIGIHLGDVQHQDGDVFGDGVNIASRIEPLAEPGGIAVTRQVYDHVHNKIDWELKSLGAPQLKNITTVIEIFRVELNWEAGLSHVKPKTSRQRLDQRLKIGSVLAVLVIAMIAAFLIIQSQLGPSVAHLEPGEITSIAVIPFENLSSDPENQYFTEGLAEEMRNALVKIEGLRVPSYTSSSAESMQGLSLKEIARLLNVEAILEGTVRKSGDQLRITAQFIRASDDTHLWSETFDKQAEDIFAIQEEIAQSIVRKLGFESTPNKQIVKTGTESTEAYNLYLQGRFQWNKRTEAAFERAINYFEQALKIDPNYDQAYVGLADVYAFSGAYGYITDDEGSSKAEEYAQTALEINENSAGAYAILGYVQLVLDGNFEKAEQFLLKSIELDPYYASARQWYAGIIWNRGQFDEASIQKQLAHELDPLSPAILSTLAGDFRQQGRYEEAIAAAEKIFEINPDSINGFMALAAVYQEMGEWGKAEEILRQGIDRNPDDHSLHEFYGVHNLWVGNYQLAEVELQRAFELGPKDEGLRTSRAIGYLLTGRLDEALAQFQEILVMDKESIFTHFWIAWTYYFQGETELGLEALQKADKLIHPSNRSTRIVAESLKGIFYAQAGDVEKVEATLELLQSSDLYLSRISPYNIAHVYAALGDADNTLMWLDKAIDEHNWLVRELSHPHFKPFFDDPRYHELQVKMGLAD